MSEKKIIEHPSTRLAKLVEEQSKEIQALRLDVQVLRDLLKRTVRIMAKYENDGLLKPTIKKSKPSPKK